MHPEEIARNYFYPGTRGYKMLRVYYTKYQDLFSRTLHHEFEEFLNQILLNVSSINFSEEIKNVEAYMIGTLKIQCRVQLDQALKIKNRIGSQSETGNSETEEKESFYEKIPSSNPGPQESLEGQEIFTAVNVFKLTLKSNEVDMLNFLIDGTQRIEIAEKQKMNLNTVDTQIRRLRIKFLEYLKSSGYTFPGGMFSKFDII